jgi:hypothetical protein
MRAIIALTIFLASTGCILAGEPLDTPRIEMGPIIGSTAFGDKFAGDMRFSLGGRFTLNLNPRFAIEYQMAWIQSDTSYPTNSSTQGSGHLKYKVWRSNSRRFDIFAVVGPGFMHEEYQEFDQYVPSMQIKGEIGAVAFDYGGGVEVIPHRRFAVRLDITDFSTGQKLVTQRLWNHHLDIKGAVMFRF